MSNPDGRERERERDAARQRRLGPTYRQALLIRLIMVVFRRTVNDEAAAIQPPSRFCPEFYGGASAKRTLLRLIEGGVIVAVVGDYLPEKTGRGKRTRMPNYLSLYPFLVRSTNRGIVGLALALALAAAAGNLLHGYARSLLRLRGIRN